MFSNLQNPIYFRHRNNPRTLEDMDTLFDRLETLSAQGIITEDELETIKAGLVELALIDAEDEPDLVATDGRSLVIHAKEACEAAGIDLESDEYPSGIDMGTGEESQ